MPKPIRRILSPTSKGKPTSPQLNPEDLKNLRASGISDATIRENGLYSNSKGLVFPYCDINGISDGFTRTRLRIPERDKSGKAIRYRQATGTKLRSYLPKTCLSRIQDSKFPLFITEGEKKALALSQVGYAALGIGGVWSGVQKDKKTLIEDLQQISLKGRNVYIVFDYDEKPATKIQVQKATKRLAQVLRYAGAGQVFRVILPSSSYGKKQGADDFLVANGKGSFQRLVDRAKPLIEDDCSESSTMADAAELIAGIEYLIPGWIPLGMITGLVAQPGVGKSALVLHEIVRPMVSGKPWFTGDRGTSGKVLWCDTENGMAITIQRMKQWKIPMERVSLPFPDPLKAVDLSDEQHIARIESLILREGIKATVIDSLRGSHDGDENSSRVGRVLQNLAGIAERTRCAIVVIHHTRKLMEDEEVTANSSRGSNAILAMMRSQIGIDRPDPTSKRCRVRMLKENLGIAPDPVGFEITDRGLVFGQAPAKPQRQTRRDAAQEFLTSNMTPGKWHKANELIETAENEGISKAALQRAKAELGIEGKKVKDGWNWKLPEG